MKKKRPGIQLTIDEMAFLRSLLQQVAPSPDGNIMKLADKLFECLDGHSVPLDGSEVLMMRNLTRGLIVDDGPEPLEFRQMRSRIVTELSRALKT
jgi:hypothetical protein